MIEIICPADNGMPIEPGVKHKNRFCRRPFLLLPDFVRGFNSDGNGLRLLHWALMLLECKPQTCGILGLTTIKQGEYPFTPSKGG